MDIACLALLAALVALTAAYLRLCAKLERDERSRS
jgi:hypothetical protein